VREPFCLFPCPPPNVLCSQPVTIFVVFAKIGEPCSPVHTQGTFCRVVPPLRFTTSSRFGPSLDFCVHFLRTRFSFSVPASLFIPRYHSPVKTGPTPPFVSWPTVLLWSDPCDDCPLRILHSVFLVNPPVDVA